MELDTQVAATRPVVSAPLQTIERSPLHGATTNCVGGIRRTFHTISDEVGMRAAASSVGLTITDPPLTRWVCSIRERMERTDEAKCRKQISHRPDGHTSVSGAVRSWSYFYSLCFRSPPAGEGHC